MANIGGLPVTKLGDKQERLSMLLWGRSGCGKTVLASTAPGPLLWINFDPDGVASLARRDDIEVVDFSNVGFDKVPSFKTGEAVESQLRTYLTQQSDCATVVVDSMTSFSQLAMTYAVMSGKASGGQFKASMEIPGMQGYGIRNRLVLDAVNMFLRVTGQLQRNLILICHEDSPKMNSEGVVQSITILLGGTLPEEVPLKISEVWHLLDTNGKRTIGIRPYAARSPMRTRMFRHSGLVTNFPFLYDQQTGKGDGIKTWYDKWKETGFTKIPTPAS